MPFYYPQNTHTVVAAKTRRLYKQAGCRFSFWYSKGCKIQNLSEDSFFEWTINDKKYLIDSAEYTDGRGYQAYSAVRIWVEFPHNIHRQITAVWLMTAKRLDCGIGHSAPRILMLNSGVRIVTDFELHSSTLMLPVYGGQHVRESVVTFQARISSFQALTKLLCRFFTNKVFSYITTGRRGAAQLRLCIRDGPLSTLTSPATPATRH